MTKTLHVTYADGGSNRFTVPDDFHIYADSISDEPGSLRWKSDDLELWVDEEGLRSVYLIPDAAEPKAAADSTRRS